MLWESLNIRLKEPYASSIDVKKILSGAPVKVNIELFLRSVTENPIPAQIFELVKRLTDLKAKAKMATHYDHRTVY